MIREKTKVNILGFYELFLPCFCQESRGYLNLKLVSTSQTHEITNHKLQKTKLFPVYYMDYCIFLQYNIFASRKENKISFISIPKISIYLFMHFFSFNSQILLS